MFHRVEDPKHPGQYLYPGVFFIGTKKNPTYYIRYRDKEGKARFEKAGPTAHTAALAADIRRDRIRGREEPNAVRKAAQEAEKKISTTFQEYSDAWLERKKPTVSLYTGIYSERSLKSRSAFPCFNPPQVRVCRELAMTRPGVNKPRTS